MEELDAPAMKSLESLMLWENVRFARNSQVARSQSRMRFFLSSILFLMLLVRRLLPLADSRSRTDLFAESTCDIFPAWEVDMMLKLVPFMVVLLSVLRSAPVAWAGWKIVHPASSRSAHARIRKSFFMFWPPCWCPVSASRCRLISRPPSA